MVDCTLEPILCSGIKYSVGKVIAHSFLCRQETPYKLERSTSWFETPMDELRPQLEYV